MAAECLVKKSRGSYRHLSNVGPTFRRDGLKCLLQCRLCELAGPTKNPQCVAGKCVCLGALSSVNPTSSFMAGYDRCGVRLVGDQFDRVCVQFGVVKTEVE